MVIMYYWVDFLIITFAVLYLYFNNTTLQVSRYEVLSKKTAINFDSFKIAQISDYHNERNNKLNVQLIGALEEEKPDIIVLTGDFMDYYRTNVDVSIKFIEKIIDFAPIYCVSGNHEARSEVFGVLKKRLKKHGVIVLENRSEVISRGNLKINIVGISDPQEANVSETNNKIIIDKEIKKANFIKENFTVLLSHRPEVIDIYSENKIDLALCGHAHGGQLRLFGRGFIAPNQGFFPKYTGGLYYKKDTCMAVCRGIGGNVRYLRVNNRPELVIVSLKDK